MSVTIEETMQAIRKFAPDFYPRLGIILGSGLSALAEQITDAITIPYQAIPGIMASNVAGHASQLVLGYLNDVPVACLKGRIHLYEGVPFQAICQLVRMIRHLGAHGLIVTGAAGSLRAEVGPGELVLIKDHINFQPSNPLVGPNDESIGPRFVSLEGAYDPGLNDLMLEIAKRMNINLHPGVYLATLGPAFETPAEIRAFRTLGADAVGMSVVPEVLVARHCGLKVLGLAGITNLAVGMSTEKVTHEGTLHYGEMTARNLIKLIPQFVQEAGPIIDG